MMFRALGSLFLILLWQGLPAHAAGSAEVSPATRTALPVSGEAAARLLPPTIADLVVLLQSYRPDAERVARLRQEMNAAVAESGDAGEMARAWHTKASAAAELQELEKRTAFLEKALDHARTRKSVSPEQLGGYLRVRSEYAASLVATRGVAASLDSFSEFVEELRARPPSGFLIHAYCEMAGQFIHLGDIENARAMLARAEATYKLLAQRGSKSLALAGWQRMIEAARGYLLRREGRTDDEERAFLAALRSAEEDVIASDMRQRRGGWSAPASRLESNVDSMKIWLAQTYVIQQRLDEAELLSREVLKSTLVRDGLNNALVGRVLRVLASVYANRGRFQEALVMADWGERVLAEAGMSVFSPPRANARIALADALMTVGRYQEAATLIDAMRAELKDDSRLEEGFAQGTLNSVRTFIAVGRIKDALRDGENLTRQYERQFGADHYFTAEARAYRAMALHRSGRVDEARDEFERSVAILLDPSRAVGKQQASAGRTLRLRGILDEYLGVLVGSKGTREVRDTEEAFRIADVARWQSVQKAVAGSALRAAAGTPELAERIKRVQDVDDELQAVYKNLISLRSAPPERQLPKVIADMEVRIGVLKQQEKDDLAEIRRQFPQYDALVNPQPANVAAARKALRAGEALVSVYVTRTGTYVWALAGNGALRFHFSRQGREWIDARVRRLRESVDLTQDTPLEKMRFDLQAGNDLYQELLAPVEAAWEGADTLLVVANDALGQIPFSLLPTARTASDSGGRAGKAVGKDTAKDADRLPFAQYRQTPWLARRLAVAYLPSVSALVTLRAMPAAAGQRDPFVGFGDPDFGDGTERKTATNLATSAAGSSNRGGRIGGTRQLSMIHRARWSDTRAAADATTPVAALLTPLPDTRDEITAIGQALSADMQRDVFFGDRASREAVLSADMKRRRVIAFATHGLVAGDLPGLDQPALALAPGTGHSLADGLLKLDDILKLTLDADLVVLSACNTAAADGSGAEAVSGLGRGFFHAGARAVLATHWPVETASARRLVTHLFERYAKDDRLTRAQALRQAMLDLIDRDMAMDAKGVPSHAYAHPAFWAPYALYGDPGR